jgi:hypothetical protein
MKKKLTRYKIETLYTYGWDDAGWTLDDKPWRFTSKHEAQKAIDELCLENNREKPEMYRVVKV